MEIDVLTRLYGTNSAVAFYLALRAMPAPSHAPAVITARHSLTRTHCGSALTPGFLVFSGKVFRA
jgi:hypothetical protein